MAQAAAKTPRWEYKITTDTDHRQPYKRKYEDAQRAKGFLTRESFDLWIGKHATSYEVEALSAMGDDGWELCGVVVAVSGGGGGIDGSATVVSSAPAKFYWKRLKP